MSVGNRLRAHLWMVIPAITLIFIAWDGLVRGRHILERSASYGVTVDPPPVDPSSITGYEAGRRSLVLPTGATDTTHWVMQTQRMIAEGRLRVRHVDYDNAPDGREVHWASPLRWWLASLAWGDRLVSSRPIGISVERAALLAGPLMLTLALPALAWLLQAQFSWRAAGVLAIGIVATHPFYSDFMAGRADHHGMANLCALLTVLLLLAGCREATARRLPDRSDPRSARPWFIASGIAGGAGLWISAATQVPVLIGTGAGLLAATWLVRKEPDALPWTRIPSLLRTWGWWGGGTSFAAYLLEYFPGHLGLRLEVNHPLYALAWIGAGEVLRIVTVIMSSGRGSLSRRDRTLTVFAFAALCALPAIIALTKTTTFMVADPFLWQLHSLHISEFQGMNRLIERQGLTGATINLMLPLVAVILPLGLLLRTKVPRDAKALLVLALLPAFLGWFMAWQQVRWLGLAFALTVPVIALCFRIVEAHATAGWKALPSWCAAGGLLLFTPGMIASVNRTLASTELSREEILNLAGRDVAHWLRVRAGARPPVVAGAPNATTWMIYQGGATGLGTLYWENTAGLRKAADFFAAPSSDAAHELARAWGLTHVVFFSWDAFEVALAKLQRGLPESAPLPPASLIANLLGAPVPPPWLRPIAFPLPDHPVLQGAEVRIWEVTEPMSLPKAAVRAASYQLESGLVERAQQFVPLLARFPDDLPALALLARIAHARQDAAAFSAAFEQLRARLPRTSVLSFEEHLHVVKVLADGGQPIDAREHLQLCLQKADEPSLRQLTPGMLGDLLALCREFDVPLPDPELQQLAERLLPVFRRG